MVGKGRIAVTAAIAVATLMGVGACGNSTPTTGADENGITTISFWTNATTGDGKAYWDNIAKKFNEKYPNVKVTVQNIQDGDIDQKEQTGLQDPKSGPNIFFERGGQKLISVVKAGQVLDLTDLLSDTTKTNFAASLGAETVDGKVYAFPVDLTPEGFWYHKDMWAKAGLTDTPTTIEEFEQDIATLKEKLPGITPVALGGKTSWPAAHYWYQFAIAECSQETLDSAASNNKFEGDCWAKAGDDVTAFMKATGGVGQGPFQPGWLTTDAQQGAASSAGLVANGKAVMELMGAWEPGQLKDLTPDKTPVKDLGFFPFPAVSGGEGTPGAMMSGADGYACSAWTPKDICANFFNFIAETENQKDYYTAFQAIPASTDAQSVVTDPTLQQAASALANAPYVVQFLDTLFGSTFGVDANTAMVNQMAGKATPQDVIDAANASVAQNM